jgi:hypothetical protein
MMEKHKGKKHGSKHGRNEMRALKRGGASRSVMAAEAAEYGMKDGGYVCGHRSKQDYGKR